MTSAHRVPMLRPVPPAGHHWVAPWLPYPDLPMQVVRTGPLVVDVGRLEVLVDGRPIHVPATELKLLVLLACRLGRAVLYEELVRRLWWPAYDARDGAMRRAHHHVVRVTCSRLRARLGIAASLLVTIPTVGLRLEAVEIVAVGQLRPGVELRARRWAQDWDRCRDCGETAIPHHSHGRCERCAHVARMREQRRKDDA